MRAKESNDNISLELSKEEALVFLDWLFRFNENENDNSSLFEDQAEERIFWDIEATLEKVITATLESNYSEILSKARKKVRD